MSGTITQPARPANAQIPFPPPGRLRNPPGRLRNPFGPRSCILNRSELYKILDVTEAMLMRIAVVTGNPRPASRTHGVALAVAGTLRAALVSSARSASMVPPDAPPPLDVDLAGHAPALFDPADPELTRLTAEVAAADVAIFASPTYKAAYTGMLKAFLDRYGGDGLAGTVAVPVMTGGWPGHLLAVEVHLRPVLVELGAIVPARGLYVTEPDISTPDAAIAKWAETAVPLIRRALAPAPMIPNDL
jgi:FMN reductase